MAEENEDQEDETGTGEDPANGETPEEKVARLETLNKRLFGRAKTAETELKVYKTQKEETKVETPTSPKIDDSIWDVADYIREGYSRKDVQFIMANGGRQSLEDPNSHVSLAMKVVKEQRAAEAASSQTEDKSGYSEVERKYTPEQLKAMPKEELAKILPHA